MQHATEVTGRNAPGFYSGPPLTCGARLVDLARPAVMGVLNITPDSFSDGGKLYRDGGADIDAVLRRAAAMVAEGAAIVDVGGESTRPGASPVGTDEELGRVVPVIAALARELDVVISVDTSTPAVMREAVGAGACMINDVRALTRDGALAAAAASDAAVCLMHMLGEPATMQCDPVYGDVVAEVAAYLLERRSACLQAGIGADRIVVDPGFGFGKTLAHNLELLRCLPRLAVDGTPLLAGLSRKSTVAKLTGRPMDERLAGSVALAVLALERGAAILRVHDVGATIDAVNTVVAVLEEGGA